MGWFSGKSSGESYESRDGNVGRGHVVNRDFKFVGKDVTGTRATTPINGSGAYSNREARGHDGGSSRPGGSSHPRGKR